jgi:hypothetical protein
MKTPPCAKNNDTPKVNAIYTSNIGRRFKIFIDKGIPNINIIIQEIINPIAILIRLMIS